MKFHRDNVAAGKERSSAKARFKESSFIRWINGLQRERISADQSSSHVAAEHFCAVQVNYRPIVANQPQAQGRERGGIGHSEGATEISRDMFVVWIVAEADRRDFSV